MRPLLVVVALAGCSSAGSWLAELVSADPGVEEERAGAPGRWTEAKAGHRYGAGDAVRTGAATSAVLRLATGEEIRLDPSSILRLGQRPREVALELGLAEVISGEGTVRVETSFGAAVIDPRGRARVSRRQDGWEVSVVLGEALLDDQDGEDTRLAAGRTVRTSFGGAIIEAEPGPTASAPSADPAAAPAPLPEGTITAKVTGIVEQQPPASGRPAGAAFAPVPLGDAALAPGTRVRLGDGAELRLERDAGHVVLHGPAVAVVAPRPELAAVVESGRVAFEARDAQAVGIPGATLARAPRAQAAGRGEAAVGSSESHVHVSGGELTVRGRGKPVRLAGAESVSVSPDGRVTAWRRSHEHADLLVAPGESPIVHDPSPPTEVGISLEKVCPGGGVLAVGAGARAITTSGRGVANVLLPRGTHRYQVRCLSGGLPGERAAARGVVRVLRDAGQKALPVRPQKVVVDADGRRWKVVYQTLLPEITFRWPAKGKGGRMALHVVDRGRGGERTLPAEGPSFTLGSGGLAEGTFQWWFAPAAGGPASPRTELAIVYDSTASSASIREPGVNAAWSPVLSVAGEVDAGWRVEVEGKELVQDAHRRFTAEVPAPAVGVLAIRLIHRKKGLQVYLRRNAAPRAAQP